MGYQLFLFLIALLSANPIFSIELTFELYDNAKDCFYEVIKENTSVTLEYQVVTGGQYDVDAEIQGPQNEIIYQQYKSQFDSTTFNTKIAGVYAICFSNEFSTFSHKIVYMDLVVGEEKPLLKDGGEHITVMTLMETSSMEIHRKLSKIIDYQTHHRLREASNRNRAENLNDTVFWWCLTETCVIVITMFSQVFIVKNFFSDNRPYQRLSRH